MHGYRADLAYDGERVRREGVLVLVEDGCIVGVEPAAAPAPDGCPVTYEAGTTLLPGLVEAHTHLCADSGPRALDQLPELTAADLDRIIGIARREQLAAGVTSVRDLGDRDFAVLAHRGTPGPTIVASGPPITTVGGHCWGMGGEVTGVDGIRRAVRERAERGADVVKIMASGGLMTAGSDLLAAQFSTAELRAAVEEAHRLGLPLTAHAHAVAAVEQAVEVGVDGIEHCSCLTDAGFRTPPGLAERIAAAGIPVCPTLGFRPGIEMPARVRALLERTHTTMEDRRTQVGDLHRAGVRLISGGDSGINPGKPHGLLPISIGHLVASGVPATAALASATGTAAAACGLAGRTGRLAPGLDADLLLVAGDPTRDIAALSSVRLVVSRGTPHPVAGVIGASDRS